MKAVAAAVHQWWYSIPVSFALLLVVSVATAFFLWHPVLPGIAIAVLGAAAAIMSFLPDMKGGEKAPWCLIVGMLLAAEIRSIRKDRAESNEEQSSLRTKQNNRLNSIVKTLKSEIDANQAGFAQTMGGISQNLDITRSALLATQQTLENTRPHANFQYISFTPSDSSGHVGMQFGVPTLTNISFRMPGTLRQLM